MTNGGRLTAVEDTIGQKIIEANQGSQVTVIIDKIPAALDNRTRAAIYVSLPLTKHSFIG